MPGLPEKFVWGPKGAGIPGDVPRQPEILHSNFLSETGLFVYISASYQSYISICPFLTLPSKQNMIEIFFSPDMVILFPMTSSYKTYFSIYNMQLL